MRKSFITGLTVMLIVLSACSSTVVTQTDKTTLAENSAAMMPTFIAPEGWAKKELNGLTSFTAPEGDAFMALVPVATAGSAEDAASQAWAIKVPDFAREVKLNTEDPTERGWDEIRSIRYETSPTEERLVYAFTHTFEGQWFVLLMEGNLGTINKRIAAARTFWGSLTRSGYEKEDLTSRTAKKLNQKDVQDLLDFVETSARALMVPGVGVGLIQDGKVIYSGGVGVKDVTTGTPIDGDTRFMIASNTKGMTTLLLAKLVEMGRMNWDDPVIKHYPDFRLGDEETTESVLIRHLVCACTGLPRKDYEWIFNNTADTAASEVFEELSRTQPTSKFGDIYQYSNQMAAAAGYVAAHVLFPDMEIGAAYDRAMQEYVFDPLDMTKTTFDFAVALDGKEAKPYAVDLDGQINAVRQGPTSGFNHTVSAYRPAGAAWSTPTDMLRYIQNELTEGVSSDGTRLFAAGPLLERRVQTVATGAKSFYGMGLSTRTEGGVEIVQHGGSMGGYKSQMVIIPDANVGAVILTNSDEGGSLLSPFGRKIVEILFDADSKAIEQVETSAKSNADYRKNEREGLTAPADPVVVEALAAQYVSPLLGPVSFERRGEQVVMDTGLWSSLIGSKTNQDGTRSIMTMADAVWALELVLADDNGKRALKLITPQHSYMFTEVE